jgi:hypothetical protein
MSNAWPDSAFESSDPLGGGYGEEDSSGIGEELAIESSDPLAGGYGEEVFSGIGEELGESYTDDAEGAAGSPDLALVLGEALRDEYAYATAEELDEALGNVLESLAPAEAINFAKTVQQAGKRLREDPTLLAQIAKTALPLAGGGVAGPAGMAVGGGLGDVVGQALAGHAKPAPAAGAPAAAKPAAAAGSPAAASAAVLSQMRLPLLATLATAMGEHGRKTIDGVAVNDIMHLLGQVFEKAASDADELQQRSSERPAYLLDAEGDFQADPAAPADRARALYTALVAAETEALSEAGDVR